MADQLSRQFACPSCGGTGTLPPVDLTDLDYKCEACHGTGYVPWPVIDGKVLYGVPYADLPAEQKVKDGLFIAVVSTLSRTSADEGFPRDEGDVTVIGPECFAAKDGSVLCWKGENYVPQPEPSDG